MEYMIVNQPTRSPNCCSLCRGSEGPFLEVPNVKMAGVPTAEGPIDINAYFAFCLGPDDNHPGCLFKMARFADCLMPSETANLRGALAAQAKTAEILAEKLAKARRSIDALTDMLHERTAV